MKILHTADLHLGAPMRAHLPQDEGKLRQGELLSAFLRLIDYAKSEGCAAVLIAGDLFDSEGAAALLCPAVFSEIEKTDDIDFYYAPGNHEKGAAFTKNIPQNLHIFTDEFSYFRKEDAVICGKKAPKGTDFANLNLQSKDFNILVLHGEWTDGASDGAEIPLRLLKNKGIDYCALGHYHTHEERMIDGRGIAVYAGCPEGRGFDETGPKGAVLLELGQGQRKHRFIPLARRTLHCIAADVSEGTDPLSITRICEKAAEGARREDLVRLVLTGERKCISPIDTQALSRHFCDRFYYIEVQDRSTLCPDVSALRAEDTVLGEFIRLAEADERLTEEQRGRVLALGLSALGVSGGGI